MRYAKDIKHLENKEKAEGKPVKALEIKPVLYKDLETVWNAFLVLHNRRNTGNGISVIPTVDIIVYLDFLEVEGQDKEEMIGYIIEMDGYYMSYERSIPRKDI